MQMPGCMPECLSGHRRRADAWMVCKMEGTVQCHAVAMLVCCSWGPCHVMSWHCMEVSSVASRGRHACDCPAGGVVQRFSKCPASSTRSSSCRMVHTISSCMHTINTAPSLPSVNTTE